MPLKEIQNYRNTSIVTKHLHQYLISVANCLPSHNYTEVTSYMSLQGLKYEAIFPLFLSNICRENCDAPKYKLPQLGLVGGMKPNMNILLSVANGTKISHKT